MSNIVFNSSVIIDNGEKQYLDWKGKDGIYTASANGTWRMEITRRANAEDIRISAKLDKVYDKVEFFDKVFENNNARKQYF